MSESRRKPDFIGIGPTKTGTSWLYTVLRLHPEIWLPPVSEVNFYWGTGKRQDRGSAWNNFKQRIKGDIRIRWRKTYTKERFAYYKDNGWNWKSAWWDLRYLFFPQTPGWYHGLYHTEKLAGDITGGYFTMDDQAIAALAKNLPHAKIIMTFRDPVSRLWSEAKMILLFLQKRKFADVSRQEFFTRFDRAHARIPDYWKLYERWANHFPKEQILVLYYDDLLKDPVSYLRNVCTFLGISADLTPEMQKVMHQKVFEGEKVSLPDEFRKYLIAKTLPDVKALYTRTKNPHVLRWIEEYNNK